MSATFIYPQEIINSYKKLNEKSVRIKKPDFYPQENLSTSFDIPPSG